MPIDRKKKKIICDEATAAWIEAGYAVVPSHAEQRKAIDECCAQIEPVAYEVLGRHGVKKGDLPHLADAFRLLSSLAAANELSPQDMEAMIEAEEVVLPALKEAVRVYL